MSASFPSGLVGTSVAPNTFGSQALQQPQQTIYLSQTNPTLNLPLSSAYGGLDNRKYNTGDFLVNTGGPNATFIILSITNAGDIMVVDTTQTAGVKWSSALSVVLSNIEYYNSQKLGIQNNINLLNDEYLSIGVAISSINIDTSQLQNNIASLNLYIAGQQDSIANITSNLVGLTISIDDTVITINNLQAGLDAINTRVTNVNNTYLTNITTISNLSNIISQSQTNLANQQLTSTGTINQLTNGNFTVWQRATSFGPASNTNPYLTADRWYHSITHGGILTSSQILVTIPDTSGEVYNGLLLNVTSNPNNFYIGQLIEGVSSLIGTMTISIWLQASISTTLTLTVTQHFGIGGSPDIVTFIDNNVTFSTPYNYINTFTLASTSSKTIGYGSYISIILSGPTWTNVVICRVQLQYGSTSLTFDERQYQTELLICKRFYETGTHVYGGYIDGNQIGYTSSQYNVIKYSGPYGLNININPVSQSAFTLTSAIGLINTTRSISSSRVKTNVTGYGSFVNSFTTDAEIYL